MLFGEAVSFLPRHIAPASRLRPHIPTGVETFRAQVQEDRCAVVVYVREEGVEAETIQ